MAIHKIAIRLQPCETYGQLGRPWVGKIRACENQHARSPIAFAIRAPQSKIDNSQGA